jgi:hypothetical protein
MMVTPTYIGFTAAPKLLGRLIRWASDAPVSHTFFAWGWSVEWGGIMTLGANPNGLTVAPLEHFAHSRPQLYKVVDPEVDLWEGVREYRDMIDCPYAYGALLGMGMVELARHLLRRRLANPFLSHATLFCSEYVTRLMKAGRVKMPSPPPAAGSTDPGQVLRIVLASKQFKEEKLVPVVNSRTGQVLRLGPA